MMESMKLAAWAKENGVSGQTATRWFHSGVLAVDAGQLSTGAILVEERPLRDRTGVALFARVSSSDQRSDLDRQLARLTEAATTAGLARTRAVSEGGRGRNGNRSKLEAILRDASLGVIVVEHRDRLGRFGVEYLEAALSAQGRQVIVVNDAEVDDDLVRDTVEVLTSLCARVYGRRSAKRRAQAAIDAASRAAKAA